jgi:hypothetical protein
MCSDAKVLMDENISHIYCVAPWYFGMAFSKQVAKVVCSFANDLELSYHSVYHHIVVRERLVSLAGEVGLDLFNSIEYVP